MGTSAVAGPQRSRARIAWILAGIAASVVVIALIAWAASFLGFGFSNRPAQLSDVFVGLDDEISPVENTAELCADVACDEGWTTDVGTYLRFETEDLAEYWSIVIGGETYRHGMVILDLNGYELTTEQREISVQLLFPGRDWHVVAWDF